jgi:hypothetical protein
MKYFVTLHQIDALSRWTKYFVTLDQIDALSCWTKLLSCHALYCDAV